MDTSIGNRSAILDRIANMWWIVLLRGIAGILLGAALFSQVSITLPVLAKFMAIYWLADGIFMLVVGITIYGAQDDFRKWVIGRGILGILAAYVVLALQRSEATATFVLVLILGIQAIIAGIVDLASNMRLRRAVEDEWAMALGAVAQIIFGILVIVAPEVTLALIVPMIGGLALLAGIGMIFFSWRTMRKLGKQAGR
ncbi:MAG: HdeD family acid-resistance protein [Anaerolineae bacterium]